MLFLHLPPVTAIAAHCVGISTASAAAMEFPPHAALPIAIRWGIIGCGSVCEVRELFVPSTARSR